MCANTVVRSMVSSTQWFPQGRMHVIPLLNLCLPGIDPNDSKKTLVGLSLHPVCCLWCTSNTSAHSYTVNNVSTDCRSLFNSYPTCVHWCPSLIHRRRSFREPIWLRYFTAAFRVRLVISFSCCLFWDRLIFVVCCRMRRSCVLQQVNLKISFLCFSIGKNIIYRWFSYF